MNIDEKLKSLIDISREETVLKQSNRHRTIQTIAGICFIPFAVSSVFFTWHFFGFLFAAIPALASVYAFWLMLKQHRLTPAERVAQQSKVNPKESASDFLKEIFFFMIFVFVIGYFIR